jgi:uncharacterized protein YPO0396
MDRELAEIIEHLEALKASADKLGVERGRFIRHIEAAEAQLDAAKRDLEQSKTKDRG